MSCYQSSSVRQDILLAAEHGVQHEGELVTLHPTVLQPDVSRVKMPNETLLFLDPSTLLQSNAALAMYNVIS